MSGINTNLNPAQSLTSIGYRGISPFSAGVTPTPPEVQTYATWNPADKATDIVLSNGNLTATQPNAHWAFVRSTIGKSSGKWYWESTVQSSTYFQVGVQDTNGDLNTGIAGVIPVGCSYNSTDGGKVINGAGGTYGAPYTTGDIIGVALDMLAGTVEFYKNGVAQGAIFGLSGTQYAANSIYQGSSLINFGATPFAYSVPSGYNAGLYDTVDLSAGLVAHYPLATNSLDTSGNGYDGTDTNVTYSAGSAVFNGSNSSISKTSFPALTTFTTSLWLNSDTASGLGAYKYAISSSENNPSGYFNFSFVFDHGDGSFAQAFVIHNGSGYQKLKIQGFTLQASTDYNIVMSYAGGSGGVMNIYVNGVLNNTMNLSGAIGSVNPTLCIGADNFSGTPGNFFDGSINKARIYNRVLNAGEIAALYAEG